MNAFKATDERGNYKVPQQPRRAIIIGSGFGGLAAAIRLSVKGYQVQIFEKLDMAGGRAYVHKQDGFTFDAGPTIITLPYLIEAMTSKPCWLKLPSSAQRMSKVFKTS